mmetsp:Transcript_11863/g.30095  ORF Transcript_11863/g.30095 Transcript_11863/m.30095 type:complete len:201 (+) Transcript_11863:1685-2287(+)
MSSEHVSQHVRRKVFRATEFVKASHVVNGFAILHQNKRWHYHNSETLDQKGCSTSFVVVTSLHIDLYKFGFQMFLCEFLQVRMKNIAVPSGGTVKVIDDAITFFAGLEKIFCNIARIVCASRSQFRVSTMSQLSVFFLHLILFFHLLDALFSEVLEGILVVQQTIVLSHFALNSFHLLLGSMHKGLGSCLPNFMISGSES